MLLYFGTGEKMVLTTEQVEKRLKQFPDTYAAYLKMKEDWKTGFLEFCQGRRTMPLLYDSFFKRMFHPDIHSDRLSDLLSDLLGRRVRVKAVLPNEDCITNGDSLIIMDIVVELEDGSLADVEVQKIPYDFTGERLSCYTADMLLRQYNRVKGRLGNKFSYKDVKKVYAIVIYEKSTMEFHDIPDCWLHHGKVEFNTGLQVTLLDEYWLVALDVFKENLYTKGVENNRQNGWLTLFVSSTAAEAEAAVQKYPWLEEIYQEMASYRERPKEVFDMFSAALKQLDDNTVQYMIERQQQELDELKRETEKQKREVEEQKRQVEEQKRQVEEQKRQAEEQRQQAEEQRQQAEEQKRQVEEYKTLLLEQQKINADLQKKLSKQKD